MGAEGGAFVTDYWCAHEQARTKFVGEGEPCKVLYAACFEPVYRRLDTLQCLPKTKLYEDELSPTFCCCEGLKIRGSLYKEKKQKIQSKFSVCVALSTFSTLGCYI